MYHVTFLDQLLILLKGKCDFCGHLKLNPVETTRYACKLRLVHHGMLKESQQLEDVLSAASSKSRPRPNGTAMEEDAEEESDTDDFKEKMKLFTDRVINANRIENQKSIVLEKTEAVSEERRTIVKDFIAAIRMTKYCGQCRGYVESINVCCRSIHLAPSAYRAPIAKTDTVKFSERR